MKSVFPGAQNIGLNVRLNDLDDVLNNQSIKNRQTGKEGLCFECQNCKIVDICGGGYYPHRFSKLNEFNNPSVYCKDLYKLITHIENSVKSKIKNKEQING
jgi:uncharacterized protein